MTNRISIIFIMFSLIILGNHAAFSQQDANKWSLGVHAGMLSYYGDLSHQVLDPNKEMINPFKNASFLMKKLFKYLKFSKKQT